MQCGTGEAVSLEICKKASIAVSALSPRDFRDVMAVAGNYSNIPLFRANPTTKS
jgi:hypothetical protein